MSERSLEEEIMIKAQQNRKLAKYMSSIEELVEEQIRKAREKGEFDNLEGYGKPLDLSENPYEPPEMRMVMRILKNNDFTPHWIQLGKDIDDATANLWKDVELFKNYCTAFIREKHSAVMISRFEKKKEHFFMEKRQELVKLQKKILDYNLHCPTFRLGRANIELEEEMHKVMITIETAIEENTPGR